MNRAVISTRFLADFGQLVRELGADPDAITALAGVDRAALAGPEIEIDYGQYAELLVAAAAATGCSHFGLLLGTRHDLSILGAVGILAKHCDTLGDALEATCRYYSLFSRSSVYRLVKLNKQVLLVREPTLAAFAHDVQVQDVSLCEAYQIGRSVTNDSWRPSAVYFTHPEPADAGIYRATFGCEVYFGREVQAIAITPADLARPLSRADADTRRFIERELASRAPLQQGDICLRVNDVIRVLLATGRCTVETVSGHLGLHSRTLHRHLAHRGTTFSALLEAARCELAQELLEQTRLDILRISELLGYSDATAFSRAFRRWTGETPARWRRRIWSG